MTTRNRNSSDQAKIVKENVIRRWGRQAWSMFSEQERERLIGYEFMCLLAAQENDDNLTMNHYRDTARELLSEDS